MTLDTRNESLGLVGMALRALVAVLIVYAMVFSHRNFPAAMAGLSVSGVAALWAFRFKPWSGFLLGLVAWAMLTLAWTSYPERSEWIDNFLLLSTCSAAALVANGARSYRWVIWGGFAALALLTFEAATGGLIRDLTPPDNRPDKDDVATARGIMIVIFLAPALGLYLWRTKGAKWAKLLLVPLFFASASFGIAANLLAMAAAVVAAGMAYAAPQLSLRRVMMAAMAAFILVPLGVMVLPSTEVMAEWTFGPASWRMRLLIWKDVWAATYGDGAAAFLFGHGVESARVLGESLGPRLVIGAQLASDAVPTHPHNIVLQVWHDLGLVGVGLSLAALWFGHIRLARARLPKDATMAVTALVAICMVFALVDASLWTLWRVCAPIFAAWMLLQVVKWCKTKDSFRHGIAPQKSHP